VLPTAYRAKIPSALSYPIGAKAISDALFDVPQRELLTITFRLQTRWKRRDGTAVPYEVLKASYSGAMRQFSPSQRMAERGYNEPKWTIEVNPVPRTLKHGVQVRLIGEALPKMRNWLISNSHSLEREGYHALKFWYDETKNELTPEETSSSEWNTERV
jgi:hypothetical protein